MTQDFTTYSTPPKYLFRAELHAPFPDWVVAEPMPTADQFSKQASIAFADQARRLLPISTKSATFHSALHIFANPNDFDESVFERVKEACAMHGIEQDIAPYASLFADELEKEAGLNEFVEGRYAIDDQIGNEVFKLLPLNDAEDVTSSAMDLSKMASEHRIHILTLVPAAREIVKAAADYSVGHKLPELITRLGKDRLPDADIAKKKIKGREMLCKEADIRGKIAADYAEALEGVEERPDESMAKIAAIDEAIGLRPNYKLSSVVPTPHAIVFSGDTMEAVEKTAKENVLVREVLIPMTAVKQIPAMDAAFKFSKSAAATLAKMASTDDARDLSLAIEQWDEADQKTFLRLAAATA